MRALLLLSLCAASSAAAQSAPVAVRYEIESKQVMQGDAFALQVVVTLNGESAQELDELSLPDLSQFVILRESRASSTQVQIRNGKRNIVREQRFNYELRADVAGKRVIGETNARIGRAIARAAALVIDVLASGDPEPALGEAAQAKPGARFGNSPPPAFLEVTLDRSKAVVGQQVTATTELYTQQPLSSWPRLPSLKPEGFLCISLLGDERAPPQQRRIAGRSYYVYLANRDALFPLTAGEIIVPAQQVEVVPAGSLFSRARAVGARSEPQKLTVTALPPDGRPARFSAGNVGTFKLEASVRPQNVALGQPVTLSITATGRGMLDQVELPSFASTDAARVFPSSKKVERAASDEVIAGRVTVEMLVQPAKEGTFTIPSLSTWFFDPEANNGAGGYVELRTKALPIGVRPANSAGVDPSVARASPTGRQVLARGARPLKAPVRLDAAPSSLPVWSGAAVALLGAAALVGARARDRRRGAPAGVRAAARLAWARRVDAATKNGDLAGIEAALLDALELRCGPAVRSKPTSELALFLREHGVMEAQASDVVEAIRALEAARYAPSGSAERQQLVARVASLARAFDRVLGQGTGQEGAA